MKLLVTGSLGLVGSACMAFFMERGWDVIGIDSNMRSVFFDTPAKRGLLTLNIDIRDERAVKELFETHTFDAIIHAAGQPSHDWAASDPLTDFDVNARGTLVLLEATRRYSPHATFVYVSTDKVYGENFDPQGYGQNTLQEHPTRYHANVPFNEDMELDFAGQRSLFGCSKTAADIYVQEYGNYFGMKTACFRPGCITGKNHEGAEQHGFLAYLAKCIKEGKTYKIYGFKGKQVRDQIHAFDLASAFASFISAPRIGAVYNIGGGPVRSVSILEAGEMISKEVGKPFTYEIHEGRKGDRQWDVHDVSKFRADYPSWNYTYSLSDIIKDVCEKI